MRSAVVAMCAFGLLVASLLSYGTAVSSDYSQKSVVELIDDLTQIDSESVAIHSRYLPPVGFIVDDTPVSLRTSREGDVVPDAPPQMRELVRRGPVALPELIKHLADRRPTKLEVGRLPAPYGFMGKFFGVMYDPRVRDWEQKLPPHPPFRPFKAIWYGDTYTLKVGDVCYVLIGQIVNRHLAAVQPVPSGLLVVNSPIEVPELLDLVKSDWGSGDAETVKASLLADIRGTNDQGHSETVVNPKQQLFNDQQHAAYVVNPALQRLRLYFPDAYGALAGDDLTKKREFEYGLLSGTISGVVIDRDGVPAKGLRLAAVMQCPSSCSSSMSETITSQGGEYRFQPLPLGKYAVFSDSTKAGYRWLSPPTAKIVELTVDHPNAELRMDLPPKVGIVTIHLTDRTTGTFIPRGLVKVKAADAPDSSWSEVWADSSNCLFFPDCAISVPPDMQLLVRVSSTGFHEWDEGAGEGKPILVHSGTRLTLDIQLDPLPH
jgi:hypothetical protein